MPLIRRITRASKQSPPPIPEPPTPREIRLSFRVRTLLYPGELAEATKKALELAGIEVISCRAVFAKQAKP